MAYENEGKALGCSPCLTNGNGPIPSKTYTRKNAVTLKKSRGFFGIASQK
jgi:hypothetical protein